MAIKRPLPPRARGRVIQLTDFELQVLAKASLIPRGRLTTYAFLAQAVNRPTAVRAVANALSKNPWLIKIPCHRVVASSGQVGGYAGGVNKKIRLLKKEGIDIAGQTIKNFEKIIYPSPFPHPSKMKGHSININHFFKV